MSSGTSRLSGATSGTSSVTCPSRICLTPNFSRSTFFTCSSGSLSGPRTRGDAPTPLPVTASAARARAEDLKKVRRESGSRTGLRGLPNNRNIAVPAAVNPRKSSAPSRSRHELAAAIGAYVLHRLGARFAEGALVRADEGAPRGGRGRVTLLALGAHFESHILLPP